MKLIILRTNLIEALGVIERGVGENANLPILKSFLVKTESGRILFASTNLELAIECAVPGKVIADGVVAVPFSVFNSIIKNLAAERVTIEEKDKKIMITTDNYEAVVQGQDANEFPIIPSVSDDAGSFSISTKDLKDAIGCVIPSAQYSEIRPEISGVLVSSSDGVMGFVATDGFRLAEKTLSNAVADSVGDFSVIIPLKTAGEILRIFDGAETVDVSIDQNQILLKGNGERVISRLIDGRFPDYKAVIPKECRTEVTIDRQELINAVKLASTFSGKSNDITIRIGENGKFIEVYSADASIGENSYKVPVKTTGERFSVIFNWRYVLDGLKIHKTQNIVIGFNSSEKPVLLIGEGDKTVVYVAMPIRG
ncbi:DNA polymerase III subunit beta [Patescibacteria group bacterium]|nr:DNA polymerase III subunit beta [Patescibacteria group bacterium]